MVKVSASGAKVGFEYPPGIINNRYSGGKFWIIIVLVNKIKA
jgi:hypothetical protein